MAKNKKNFKEEKNIVAVEEALSRSEQFIERNQNLIIWSVAVVVLLIAGYIGYTRFFLAPRETEARTEMFMAEKYFEQENFQMALEGDGQYLGFLDIISEYRFTSSSNLAKYYAGISYLRLGEFEEAIDHLESFRARDQIIGAMAYGAKGDAHLELGDNQKALSAYRKAYEYKPNDFTTPLFLFKAGLVNEQLGNNAQAMELYERIRLEYPNSTEATNIDRYIGRVSALK